jgi:hypothetical protein
VSSLLRAVVGERHGFCVVAEAQAGYTHNNLWS